jgi:hypothetical protein
MEVKSGRWEGREGGIVVDRNEDGEYFSNSAVGRWVEVLARKRRQNKYAGTALKIHLPI